MTDMALLLSNSLNFAGNAILNARMQQLSTPPADPVAGQYYLTQGMVLRVYDGSAWSDIGVELTAAELLALLLTVDGPGSGLDADTLDGQQASAFRLVASQVPAADVSGLTAAIDSRVAALVDADAPNEALDTLAEFLAKIQENADLLAGLTAGNVKRYQETFGDGTATTFTFTHGLGTQDFVFTVRDAASGETVLADVRPVDANSATMTAGVAPGASAWRIVIMA